MPKVEINAPESTVQDVSVHREEFDKVKSAIDKLTETKNPVMYAFVNKSLALNEGKVAAQVMHAQEELLTEIMEYAPEDLKAFYLKCAKQNPRTVIVLGVKDTDELHKVNAYLESCEIRTGIYVDEKGENYMLEPTAMVTQYLDKTDPRVQTIFGMFDLYKGGHDVEYWQGEAAKWRGYFKILRQKYIKLKDKSDEYLREINRQSYELDCVENRGLFARIFNK